MKRDIHPEWFPDAVVICQSCGNTWQTGATVQNITTEICSNCHPFYTGEQRIVDTEGRVEKFLSRLKQRDDMRAAREAEIAARTPMDLPLENLGLTKRYLAILEENDITVVEDVINALTERGDEALLELTGIGRQVISDIKRRLREKGYTLPDDTETDETETETEENEDA